MPFTGLTIFWTASSKKSSSHKFCNLNDYINANRKLLRDKYLSWVSKFGNQDIYGKKLYDHLKIKDDFSFWWMGLIAGKNNIYVSNHIEDAIRIIAFDHFFRRKKPKKILLATKNINIILTLEKWCEKTNVKLVKIDLGFCTCLKKVQIKSCFFVHIINAIRHFVTFLFDSVRLKKVGYKQIYSSLNRVTLISYLFNIKSKLGTKEKFSSKYWGSLSNLFEKKGIRTNWIHLYSKNTEIQSPSKAISFILFFNRNNKNQAHATLHSLFPFKKICEFLFDYFNLLKKGLILSKSLSYKYNNRVNLQEFFKKDWICSTVGKSAMDAVILFNIIYNFIQKLPKQNAGFYLQENQFWEMALIHCWKKNRHGKLYAVPHSTVRFWDLRYFHDKKNYNKLGDSTIPLPDKVLVNGSLMRKTILQGGLPKQKIFSVEALRYNNLIKTGFVDKKSFTKKNNILLLGDFVAETTLRILDILNETYSFLSVKPILFFKPHPHCKINTKKYAFINETKCRMPIEKIALRCNIAIASAGSSVVLEAQYCNLNIICINNSENFNYSPDLNNKNIKFVNNSKELAAVLLNLNNKTNNKKISKKPLFLQNRLNRWNKIVSPITDKV